MSAGCKYASVSCLVVVVVVLLERVMVGDCFGLCFPRAVL